MSLTDQEIATKARRAVVEAIQDLAHDRMGLGELLEDDLDGLTEEEQDALLDRLEQAIRDHLPPDDVPVPFDPGTGPIPGYVAGRCGHRVAESEWRAGFRVCERC